MKRQKVESMTHSLKPEYLLSLAVALVMTLTAIAGIVYQTDIYPTDELRYAKVPNDIINLAVGLPILLVSMWLARCGKLIGLLCWPGALFYMLYVYLPYLLIVPFGPLFLPHLIIVSLSASTMIVVVSSINCEEVSKHLAGSVPAKTTGGILTGLAVFIIVRQTALIVTALINRTSVATADLILWIDDFMVACPALLASGILLWRRKPFGYMSGAGLLLAYGLLALGVIPVMAVQAHHRGSTLDAVDVIVLAVMALICFVPFGFFMRGASEKRVGGE